MNTSIRKLQLALFGICVVLTVVLYLKGGATNPFVSLYLVPIAIAAATLSIGFTVSLTTFCLLMYSLLLFYYQPLQVLSPQDDMMVHHISLQGEQHQMHMMSPEGPNLHVVGMWMNFGLSALLITLFVTRLAHSLRVQAAELAAIREKQLRDEQLLAIATLAAGTLHELGTPLATMALLSEDLKNNTRDNPALVEDARLLSEQVARCKVILQKLAQAAEQPAGHLQRVAIGDYLTTVLDHWRLLKPAVPVNYKAEVEAETVAGFIQADNTLEQALINLFNNAAEASPRGFDLVVTRSGDSLTLAIRDYGAGLGLAVDALGKPFVSTRGPGRGLGLFLSHAAIERLGGRVSLSAHPDGGTLATVTLPCSR